MTWRDEIQSAMTNNNETLDDTVACVSDGGDNWIDDEFYGGYGSASGCPFTLWTNNYVYFPLEYDGSEYVGYAPRNPCSTVLEHQ